MRSSRRAAIGTALLLVVAGSQGGRLVVEGRRSATGLCSPATACAPPDTPKLNDDRSVLPVVVMARRPELELAVAGLRLRVKSPTRMETDPGTPARAAGDQVCAPAAIRKLTVADPTTRRAVRGAEASPIRGPPSRS
jgi:hypothetical protein